MMGHKIGVSGSVILSDPEKLEELFWENIDHIEMGSFPDMDVFEDFLKLCRERKTSFGIHSPLLNSGSKYDLIQRVQFEPEAAWKQLELEAEQGKAAGAEYLLVHFPYFMGEIEGDPDKLIEEGLIRLYDIQQKYSIPVICEPKLGLERSAAGIDYLHDFPKGIWEKYGLGICFDIGDYLIASDKKIFDYILKCQEYIRVVHLHNVHYEGDKYIWIPVHPSHETNGVNYKVEKIIRYLAGCRDITFVFEHTPHTNPSREFVEKGYRWVRQLLAKNNN